MVRRPFMRKSTSYRQFVGCFLCSTLLISDLLAKLFGHFSSNLLALQRQTKKNWPNKYKNKASRTRKSLLLGMRWFGLKFKRSSSSLESTLRLLIIVFRLHSFFLLHLLRLVGAHNIRRQGRMLLTPTR